MLGAGGFRKCYIGAGAFRSAFLVGAGSFERDRLEQGGIVLQQGLGGKGWNLHHAD